ncbi:hypothetical protein H8A99_28265, partial [Bradyrhizobium sp. Arg68]|nr:hypothetical protein [Bradyrhizobium ivorense]
MLRVASAMIASLAILTLAVPSSAQQPAAPAAQPQSQAAPAQSQPL